MATGKGKRILVEGEITLLQEPSPLPSALWEKTRKVGCTLNLQCIVGFFVIVTLIYPAIKFFTYSKVSSFWTSVNSPFDLYLLYTWVDLLPCSSLSLIPRTTLPFSSSRLRDSVSLTDSIVNFINFYLSLHMPGLEVPCTVWNVQLMSWTCDEPHARLSHQSSVFITRVYLYTRMVFS